MDYTPDPIIFQPPLSNNAPLPSLINHAYFEEQKALLISQFSNEISSLKSKIDSDNQSLKSLVEKQNQALKSLSDRFDLLSQTTVSNSSNIVTHVQNELDFFANFGKLFVQSKLIITGNPHDFITAKDMTDAVVAFGVACQQNIGARDVKKIITSQGIQQRHDNVYKYIGVKFAPEALQSSQQVSQSFQPISQSSQISQPVQQFAQSSQTPSNRVPTPYTQATQASPAPLAYDKPSSLANNKPTPSLPPISLRSN